VPEEMARSSSSIRLGAAMRCLVRNKYGIRLFYVPDFFAPSLSLASVSFLPLAILTVWLIVVLGKFLLSRVLNNSAGKGHFIMRPCHRQPHLVGLG